MVCRENVSASLSALTTFFKLDKGNICNYIHNCLKAILKLKLKVIHWSLEQKHDEMMTRLVAKGL